MSFVKYRFSVRSVTILLCLLVIAGVVRIDPIRADSLGTNFDSFTTGSVNGQGGWQSTDDTDQEVVDNTGAVGYSYPSFGSRSLRISNGKTSDGFGDQTFANALTDEAGELNGDAGNGGFPEGTRQPFFQVQWDFASVTPAAEQTGLRVTVSPDRGDGSRMSFVSLVDTPTGLAVNFDDFQRSVDDFVLTPVATGLDRTKPHNVRITMNLVDGPTAIDDPSATAPENDIVCVFVDNVFVHRGTSWENYYRDYEPTGTRTARTTLFRVNTAGGEVPGLLGKGLLIDNFSMTSGPVPAGLESGCTAPPPSSPSTSSSAQVSTVPCNLVGGGTSSSVVNANAQPNQFCRVIVENGSYIRNAAEVGDVNLISQGVTQAVDIFAFGSGGEQITTFSQPLTVCLQGSGKFYFRDANGQPRSTALLASTVQNGYTCATIPNAGTVILSGAA